VEVTTEGGQAIGHALQAGAVGGDGWVEPGPVVGDFEREVAFGLGEMRELDFGNDIYTTQARLLSEGATEQWWSETVPVLARWLALRPFSKDEILERGRHVLGSIDDAFRRLRMAPPFGHVSWAELAPLFDVAWSIKAVNSPVFASKLCHFMRPDLYVVIDGDAVGLQAPYPLYWQACSDA